ncbi:MAG: hypothetical protein ACYC1T_12270 [Sulfuricaulis sp.]
MNKSFPDIISLKPPIEVAQGCAVYGAKDANTDEHRSGSKIVHLCLSVFIGGFIPVFPKVTEA